MDSNTDLPQQRDTLQQPLLIKKTGDHSWILFSILLILVNLLFGLVALYTFFLPLAIIDFIAVRSYIKKQSPPWKAFLISLFVFNIAFFSYLAWSISTSSLGAAGIVAIPIAFILLLIDFISILAYIYVHLPRPYRKGKTIFYIALISLTLAVAVLTIFSN